AEVAAADTTERQPVPFAGTRDRRDILEPLGCVADRLYECPLLRRGLVRQRRGRATVVMTLREGRARRSGEHEYGRERLRERSGESYEMHDLPPDAKWLSASLLTTPRGVPNCTSRFAVAV